MKGVAPKVFGFAILLFCVEAFAAGGSLGGVSLPQNTGAYTIVREGDHYNITFAIELLIGEEFHQHINQEIAFHIRRRNGGVFENWENFERDPALPEDVTGGFLHIRLKLRDITEASVPLFEFRIHFDLTQLSETMTAHVEDGVFSPAVSPTLSIHATEDPCWSV
ncbi:MAG: hypothetical protein HY609_06130, partial [Deltaproteobacteria bacterium]|nr:hypothetical protein [Deltaproteobacteria bacterium]